MCLRKQELDPPYAPPGTSAVMLGWLPLFHAVGFFVEFGLPLYSGTPYYSAKVRPRFCIGRQGSSLSLVPFDLDSLTLTRSLVVQLVVSSI